MFKLRFKRSSRLVKSVSSIFEAAFFKRSSSYNLKKKKKKIPDGTEAAFFKNAASVWAAKCGSSLPKTWLDPWFIAALLNAAIGPGWSRIFGKRGYKTRLQPAFFVMTVSCVCILVMH